MNAEDMVPGRTYVGTADGPEKLNGVAFTPIVIVGFHPEGYPVSSKEFRELSLVQVLYDAWAYPLPESIVFAPGDWVRSWEGPKGE